MKPSLNTMLKSVMPVSDVIEREIVKITKQFTDNLNSTQLWMIKHEVCTCISFLHSLLYRYYSPNESHSEKKENNLKFCAVSYGYCKNFKRPVFSKLPKSDQFIVSRFDDYNEIAFQNTFVGYSLERIMSKRDTSFLACHPFNQSIAFLSELISRITILSPSVVLKYEEDLKQSVSLNNAVSISNLSLLIYHILETFSFTILSKYTEDGSDLLYFYLDLKSIPNEIIEKASESGMTIEQCQRLQTIEEQNKIIKENESKEKTIRYSSLLLEIQNCCEVYKDFDWQKELLNSSSGVEFFSRIDRGEKVIDAYRHIHNF